MRGDVLLRESLARDAIAMAERVRRKSLLRLEDPVPIFDLVEALGIELRFAAVPSLEAMYSSLPRPVIVVSSLRPPGRQRYGCAHELGHHVFGHGMCIEDFRGSQSRDESVDEREFLAEVFAGALLMPKSGTAIALKRRQFDVGSITPEQAYVMASWFGVGYTTFLHHLRSGLRMAPATVVEPLIQIPVGKVKHQVSGIHTNRNVVPVDAFWQDRVVDIWCEDFVVSRDRAVVQSDAMRIVNDTSDRLVLVAAKPGRARIRAASWSALVRVCRREYEGRGCYRYLEESEDD